MDKLLTIQDVRTAIEIIYDGEVELYGTTLEVRVLPLNPPEYERLAQRLLLLLAAEDGISSVYVTHPRSAHLCISAKVSLPPRVCQVDVGPRVDPGAAATRPYARRQKDGV